MAQADAAPAERELTYVRAINEAVRTVLAEQPSAFVAGEDVAGAGSVFGYYGGLLKEFGAERVIDTPITPPPPDPTANRIVWNNGRQWVYCLSVEMKVRPKTCLLSTTTQCK